MRLRARYLNNKTISNKKIVNKEKRNVKIVVKEKNAKDFGTKGRAKIENRSPTKVGIKISRAVC